MRAYLLTSGAIFALIAVAHIWRLTLERHLLTEPWYLALTALAAALAVWAAALLRRR